MNLDELIEEAKRGGYSWIPVTEEQFQEYVARAGREALRVESQQQKCLRGEHEAGVVVGSTVPLFGADTDVMGPSALVRICRHCRCLFAERP